MFPLRAASITKSRRRNGVKDIVTSLLTRYGEPSVSAVTTFNAARCTGIMFEHMARAKPPRSDDPQFRGTGHPNHDAARSRQSLNKPDRVPKPDGAYPTYCPASRVDGLLLQRPIAAVLLAPVSGTEAAFASTGLSGLTRPSARWLVNPANVDRTLRWCGCPRRTWPSLSRPLAYREPSPPPNSTVRLATAAPQFGHVDLACPATCPRQRRRRSRKGAPTSSISIPCSPSSACI